MWTVKLKGFEKYEKDFDFWEDEDFIYIFKKPHKLEDRPVGIFTKFAEFNDIKDYLNKLKPMEKISKELYRMYRDSSD